MKLPNGFFATWNGCKSFRVFSSVAQIVTNATHCMNKYSPKSGVGWQLNSVLLWLRCPALRDLVNDFWQQGGGSHTAETAGSVLELSIDASDEVVETICHYVHYGGLILPPTLTLQLETLKVASELGLLALQDQLEHFLCQDINATNLDTLYQAARENRYRRIEDGCVRFMNGELQDHRREEALQRTLASSITGGFSMSQFAATATVATSATAGNGTVGTQLRTKDLHDFEDVPDDVLHGTFANRTGSGAAGGSKRNEHLSETYGGHLTASNPSVDYRAMNDEADSYLQSLKLPQKVQEYQQDMYGQHAPATDRPGSSSHANGKMKSGGIYSLLLGDNEDGFGQEGMYATDAYGKEVLKDTAKRPGSGKAGLAQTSSAAASGRKSVSGNKTLSQLQEFDPNTMSLVPRKEKNEHEKRLEELSKPRSQQQQRKSTASALATSDLDVDTSTNSDPYTNEMDRPSSTRSKPSSAASTARPGTATKRPPSGTANSQQKSTTKQPVSSGTAARGRVSSYGGEEDNDLPDDLYLQDTFIEEREDVPARLSGTMSAPSMQRPTSSSANGRGSGGTGGAPLLSSVSNPRLRTSTEPVFPSAPTDGDASPVLNDYHSNTGAGSSGNGGGGTQIRSSLALLKAKVSKTGGGPASGRTRRISAGAAVGNFAGTDSESPSPVPSSSSAGQVSGPSSLNNTLEGNNGRPSSGTLRQSFNRTGSDRYNQNNNSNNNGGGGYASSSQQQHRSAYDDDDDGNAYADDFDHDDGGYGATSTSRSKSLGASRGGPIASSSGRSNQQHQQQQQSQKAQPRFNQGYEETDDREDDAYPPRSSAAAYLQRLENDPNAYGGGDDADDDNYGAEFAGGNTMECPDCGRHFAPEPFNRHVKICKKVFLNKRKIFDSSKQRLMANPETLAAAKKNGRNKNLNKTASNGGGGGGSSSGVSKWKEQSRQFREAMRSARGATSGGVDVVVAGGGGGGGGGAPPQPYIDPTLIQCPNCQRRFNDKAAERHIPICKNIIAKPSALKKGGGQTAGTLAATQTRGGSGMSSGMSSGNGGGGGGGFNGARTTGAGRW